VTGFNERGNTDRFHRFDLNTSNIIGQSRIENRNSTTGNGFDIGQFQFLVTAYDKNLFWLNWNAQSNKLEGAYKFLGGVNGNPKPRPTATTTSAPNAPSSSTPTRITKNRRTHSLVRLLVPQWHPTLFLTAYDLKIGKQRQAQEFWLQE